MKRKNGWFENYLPFMKNRFNWALKHKKLVIFSSFGVFLISLFVFSTLGRSFLPEFNEGSLTLSVVTQPGTSLEESNLLGNLVETELLAIPEVLSTARRTGRGELDEHSQTTNSAEIDVNFTVDRTKSGGVSGRCAENVSRNSGNCIYGWSTSWSPHRPHAFGNKGKYCH